MPLQAVDSRRLYRQIADQIATLNRAYATSNTGFQFELVSTDRVRFAPVLELVGWHVLGGQQQAAGTLGPAEGTNIVNLKVGARTNIGRYSWYVGYGRALTDAVWYSDIVRVEYRFSF